MTGTVTRCPVSTVYTGADWVAQAEAAQRALYGRWYLELAREPGRERR